MIRRTVEISQEATHLAARDGQLLILRRGGARQPLPSMPENLAGRVPMEDLGLLMVDQRETTYTQEVLVAMAEHGGALVVCGRDHLPCGMYVPLSTNTALLARLGAQLAASKPCQKRVWAEVVREKIEGQARNLSHAPEAQRQLMALARRVRSGDPNNVEAQAARAYWPALFGDISSVEQPFRRRGGEAAAAAPNGMLDYGYAVLRAGVARAIISAGLLPAIGIRHHHPANAFCLADDLIEPLRPLVDARVRRLAAGGRTALERAEKAEILQVLHETVETGGETGPLEVMLVRYAASFVRVLCGEQACCEIPRTLGRGAEEARVADGDDDACS